MIHCYSHHEHHHHHSSHHTTEPEEPHDPTHFFQGDIDENAMSTDQALEHLLDDYVIAHSASSHSTKFRRLFFYFPSVEEIYVSYFGVISESYLHLCYESEMNLDHSKKSGMGDAPSVHQLDQLGASATSFVDMLHNANIYAKTKIKLRNINLIICQSKQAWDWKKKEVVGAKIPIKVPTIDEVVVQYERISFAEYVELLGRLALQLAHEKDMVEKINKKRIGKRKEQSIDKKKKEKKKEEKQNEQNVESKDTSQVQVEKESEKSEESEEIKNGTTSKQKDKTKKKNKGQRKLELDRDRFLEELPILLNKLKLYMQHLDDEIQNSKGTNLNRLLKRSNAAVRASRRKSVVAVMNTVRTKLIEREEENEKEE